MFRRFWDNMFKNVVKQVNGVTVIDSIAWMGVILGGYFAWKKHRKMNLKPVKPDFSSDEV